MQCECYSRVKNLVEERIREQMPDGSHGLEFDFPSIRIGLTDDGLVTMPVFDIKGEYQAPKKAGGFRRVKIDTYIASTYCPFCGVKCKADPPEKTASATSA
ncbi:hypothetical protein HMH05_26040 [Pseudomonas sp. SbB1]|uniref:Uncharacterized protein n=1 Tax=Pseudomonas putida (strain GB-1) TaxID=76869 RepID=B0KHC8_PSEPG|nr:MULTISPECIES: hypothetical protein [Pseudomonas]ABY97633.1 hypothetical protein PputGB1_1730 [Pseudomonas putida GB-1]MBP0710808.1 hypothetical protein [Pseudomonas sp. T34]MCK2190255.1 hypothetical protein [Pseudomonas sp. MB04B]MDD2087858.1 hypothetical protein [Pseudomonas putida]MDD2097831.1 hypothetical protein [Pseudomonas putida]